jgi:uncharacterized SAM-binding protein YcdF (DUF218 family)
VKKLDKSHRFAMGCLAVPLLSCVVLFLLHGPILRGVGNWFVVDDPPARGDFIYVLNGDPNIRPFHAASLYHEGYARRVVIPRAELRPAEAMGLLPSDTDVSIEVLRRKGVPDPAIEVLPVSGGVTSTRDEARVLRAYLRGEPATRVLVVTSSYHTRRARWTIERELGDAQVEIRMMAAPDERFGPADWWTNETGFLSYINEMIKWTHTLLVHHPPAALLSNAPPHVPGV